jgi:hypothetical protein
LDHRFLDIKANPNNGQTGFSFENNSYIYAGTYRITVSSDGPGNTIIHMQDGARFYLNELHFMGETSSPVGTLLDITSSSNQFTYYGDFQFTGLASKFAAGAVVTHYLDAAGYGPAVPNSTSYTIDSIYAERIANGSNLNDIVRCGRYEGSGSPNTPLAIGTRVYRLDVVCGGEGSGQNNLTQIIYAAQSTFARTGCSIGCETTVCGICGERWDLRLACRLPALLRRCLLERSVLVRARILLPLSTMHHDCGYAERDNSTGSRLALGHKTMDAVPCPTFRIQKYTRLISHQLHSWRP